MFKDCKGSGAKAILASVFFAFTLALIASLHKWTALQHYRLGLATVFFIITLVLYGLFSIVWQELNHYISQRLGRLIRATSLFWIIIVSILFFGERLSSHVWIGALFIFAGILFAQAGSVENSDEKKAKYQHFMGDVFSAPGYLDFGAHGEDSTLLNSMVAGWQRHKRASAERRQRREAERAARAKLEAEGAERLANQGAQSFDSTTPTQPMSPVAPAVATTIVPPAEPAVPAQPVIPVKPAVSVEPEQPPVVVATAPGAKSKTSATKAKQGGQSADSSEIEAAKQAADAARAARPNPVDGDIGNPATGMVDVESGSAQADDAEAKKEN